LADLHVLPQARGAADLILPSKLGGMLASGKPMLATADADTELFEVLQGTTILVPAGDSVAMAREIGILAADGAWRWPQARPNLRPGGLSFEVCLACRPTKQPRRGPGRRSRLNFLPGRAEAPRSIRPQYILRHSTSREISRGNPPRVKPPLSFKGSFGLHWRANCIT
jgi:hypothetical protein